MTAGVSVERCEYAFVSSSILTSAAPNAKVYPYSILSEIHERPSCLRNGLTASSPPSAVIILDAGIFLL